MMLLTAIVFLPLLIALSIMFSTVHLFRHVRMRDRRRSPLTTEILRQPAQSLRLRLDALNDDISAYIAGALAMPFMASTMYFARMWFEQREFSLRSIVLYLLIGGGGTLILTVKAGRFGNERRKLLQAIDAELVVAQELEILRVSGCRIFHDLQCGDFNIDHVVVGPGGVFAVETKSRLKSEKGSGKDAVKVRYDGKALHFPSWTEVEPLQQAERQAKWLTQKLSKATGEAVPVRGVLALPGWFVDMKARGEVAVINPKKPEWMAKSRGDSRLEDAQIQCISYRLEQMSVVEPKSQVVQST